LIDRKSLTKYDPSDMHRIYDEWPQIAKKAYESDLEKVDFQDIDHIVFAGMGGSGAIGDIFSSILSKTNIHVNVVKGYLLPKTVTSNTLVIPISISGNTIETLTVLDSAKKIGCKIIAFSSGGTLQEYCKNNSIEHRKIPFYHSPRASFTSFLFSMLHVLSPVIPISKTDISESLENLVILQKQISSSNLSATNPSIELAEWVNGIPLIYYPWGLQATAIRFKSSLQENVKSHAIAEDVIEACHNGIVSWEKPSEVTPILLRGQDDYIKTKERWEILKQYFEANNIAYREIFSVKGSILSKLINLIYLLDYSTIYLAISRKIDPSKVHSIDFVKQKLS
jgi:glucose/mannose-6-phosphate isomerase